MGDKQIDWTSAFNSPSHEKSLFENYEITDF